MKKIAPAFLLLLAASSFGAFLQTQVFFSVLSYYTSVSITDVTISAIPLYAGASTDILVTLENTGTISANVSVNVSILNSSGGFVENLTYDPATVPPSSLLTISKSWSTGSNPVGSYYANASGLYESGSNSTNVFSRAFSISAAPTPTPTPGTGGGGSVAGSTPGNASTETPGLIPPEILPLQTQLRFIRSTPLKEISAGSNAVESLLLKNAGGGSKSVSVSISGAPQGWLSFSPLKSIILPNEERAINIALSVPQDALPGDYLLKIEVRDNEELAAMDYMLLRVKKSARGAQFPVVLKTVRLDRGLGTTSSIVEVLNPTTKTVPYVTVIDEVLPQLKAERADLAFSDKPAEVRGPPLLVKWQFRELAPLERATVSYSIYALLQEYRPYVYWSVKQVEVAPREVRLSDIIAIREISTSLMTEGGEGEVVAKVFYAGFEPVEYKATLELPGGFRALPLSLDGTLQPRGTTDLKFRASAPHDSEGTHSATVSVLVNDEFLVQQTGYITVQKASALSLQAIFIALLIGILLFLSYLHFSSRRKYEGERHRNREMREGYLKQIKDYLK